MKEIILIVIRPYPPDISAGAGVFVLMYIYLILSYPDMNGWLMFFISLGCGWFLTIPAGFFLLFQICKALWVAYN